MLINSSSIESYSIINESNNSTPIASTNAFRLSLSAISIVGIILNCTLFCNCRHLCRSRMIPTTTSSSSRANSTITSLLAIRRRRRHSSTTKQSLSLLSLMAAADTVSLSALLFMLSSQYIVSSDNQILSTFLCKVRQQLGDFHRIFDQFQLDLYLIHTSSAFSLWCWLVLSVVRYVAIYRPYSHLKLTNEPKRAAIVVLLLCAVFESWILVVVEFASEHHACTEDPMLLSPQISRLLHLIEISWSFFVPFVCITVIDVKVLCCRNNNNHSTTVALSTIINKNGLQALHRGSVGK